MHQGWENRKGPTGECGRGVKPTGDLWYVVLLGPQALRSIIFFGTSLLFGSTCDGPGVYIGRMNATGSADPAVRSHPLIGRTLVVTRAASQADGLVAALEALGATVVRLPTIRVEPALDQDELRRAVQNAQGYEWVIFTSANGVDFFRKAAEDIGVEVKDALAATRVCCVGPATASAIEALDLTVEVVPETHRAEAVVEVLSARTPLRGQRILIPTVAGARPVLRAGLRELGAEVDDVIAYRTVAVEAASRAVLERLEKGADLVTFTSPSTVRSFHRLVGGGVVANAAVLGPVTAGAARELGYRVAVEANPFTIPGLVKAISSHFEEEAHG